jgi:hypothetical protein
MGGCEKKRKQNLSAQVCRENLNLKQMCGGADYLKKEFLMRE